MTAIQKKIGRKAAFKMLVKLNTSQTGPPKSCVLHKWSKVSQSDLPRLSPIP